MRGVPRKVGQRLVEDTTDVRLLQEEEARQEVIPYLDHRLDEILELLKRIYELEYGFVPIPYDWYGVTVEANETLELAKVKGEGMITSFLLKVIMPDDTPPDVGPFYRYDDLRGGVYELEEWTIYDLHLFRLGPNYNPVGFVTMYETADRTYAAMYCRKLHWATECRIFLRNWTAVDVTVEVMGIEGQIRPYARYIKVLK